MSTDPKFTARFVEACGTSQPAEIQRLLNISYQAAKNYLQGRLPQTNVLIAISDRTNCSIDWLLTGRGKKILIEAPLQNTPIAAGQIEESVRRICVEVINEMNGRQDAAPKVVVLQSSELMSEKVTDETVTSSGRKR